MNISAVSDVAKRSDDFTALQGALQSGNISGAQGAFAAFLQDAQKTAMAGSGSLFAPGTQASNDLQALGGALRSANLAGARQAFSSLTQDIQGTGNPVQSHHRRTHAEIINNGTAVSGSTVQGASEVLNSRI